MHLDQARRIYEAQGPFISLHLDVSRDSEDARQALNSRWTRVRHELEHHGIHGPIVGELEERLREQTHLPGEVRRTIVATREEVLLDDARTGHTTWPETVAVGPLPDLAGWLSTVDGQWPFVVVRADRAGADIEVYVAPSRPAAERTSVEGETFDIRKLPEGDWMQKKYQQRAENNWRENAELVAQQLTELAKRYRPVLIVVAGEVRARSDLAGVLVDTDLAGATVETVESGGRAAGSSDEALWTDVRRLLGEREERETDALVQRLERGVAVGEGVATGPDKVADAFVEGKVERLVLDLQEARSTTIAASEHPGLALPQQAMDAGPLPADEVLMAAAALTDAEVSVLPHEIPLPREFALASGVAATLRWDERTQERGQG